MKIFLPEEGSDRARSLLFGEPLGAPDLMVYEFANGMVYHPALSLDDIARHVDRFYQLRIKWFVLPKSGFERAIVLSRSLGLSAYDASFVALAESLGADFVTADRKLVQKVKTLPFVRLL